jgi:hypothetical protein
MSLGQMSPSGRQIYRGRLAVEADSTDLKVDLRIGGGTVEVLTAKESLGVWSIAHVSVSRQEDGRFVLQLGDDEAFFRAEDPLLFAYEAASTIRDEQARFRNRLRAYWTPTSGEPRGSSPDDEIVEETLTTGGDPARAKMSEPPRPRAPRHLRASELGA